MTDFRTPDCQVCGLDADEILELHFVRHMVFAGPARDRLFVLQIARFVVLTGPAADEILELHFVRLMVFAGPASDRIFVLQIVTFMSRFLEGRSFPILQILVESVSGREIVPYPLILSSFNSCNTA